MRLTRREIKRRKKRIDKVLSLLEATLFPRRAPKARKRWKRELARLVVSTYPAELRP